MQEGHSSFIHNINSPANIFQVTSYKMGSQVSRAEKHSSYKYSKLEMAAAFSDNDEAQHENPRKPASKGKKNAKAVIKRVKQKAAGFGSWLKRELFEFDDLAYSYPQAYTHGFGVVALEMGM